MLVAWTSVPTTAPQQIEMLNICLLYGLCKGKEKVLMFEWQLTSSCRLNHNKAAVLHTKLANMGQCKASAGTSHTLAALETAGMLICAGMAVVT